MEFSPSVFIGNKSYKGISYRFYSFVHININSVEENKYLREDTSKRRRSNEKNIKEKQRKYIGKINILVDH